MTDEAPTVRMRGVTKRYPRVVANRDCALDVRAGEVHAVVGENGAGKSTLMKILYGIVTADDGEIEVRGRRLHRHTPAQAIEAGVGMVFQHFMLVPPLTIADNVVLGREPRRGVFYDRERACDEIRDLSAKYGLAIDPRARVEDCSVGLQQRVEILKVLLRGAEVIILDEPTAVLTPQEVDELIAVMRSLAKQGKTLLLITHKLREVMAASDRVTVMRHGETIETLETARTSIGEIAHKMVGRELDTPKRAAGSPGEVVLLVEGLRAGSDRGVEALKGVDLTVHAGEIVGVAGIEGNGQTELVECIVGLRRPTAGHVDVRPPVAHIPEDRHKRAVVLDFSLKENAVLGLQRNFSMGWSMRFGAMQEHIDRIVRECDVRPADGSLPMRALSGGNQQKVVIGRELSRRPSLLVACHPTRGLDIGAIEFVQRSMLAERGRGAGVLFVSAELPELMAMSDRVIVMAGGRIVGEVDPSQVDERRLGLMMTGAH
jgi:simple sugar transport system ATP-binding protein